MLAGSVGYIMVDSRPAPAPGLVGRAEPAATAAPLRGEALPQASPAPLIQVFVVAPTPAAPTATATPTGSRASQPSVTR